MDDLRALQGQADVDRGDAGHGPQRAVDMPDAAIAAHPFDAQGGDHTANVAPRE